MNSRLAESPVTASVAVTVTSAVPVVPTGAESRSTPFCVSVKIEAEVIVTVLSGLSLEFVATPSISSRVVLPLVIKPKMVYLKSPERYGSTVTKNCDPFESGPLFGHGQDTRTGELQGRIEFIVELESGPARPVAQGVAALDHEALDNAVESEAVVEAGALVDQLHDFVDGIRREVLKQLEGHGALDVVARVTDIELQAGISLRYRGGQLCAVGQSGAAYRDRIVYGIAQRCRWR